MKTLFLAILMIVCFSFAAKAQTLEDKIDAYIKPFSTLKAFNGAILIARGDDIVLQKGYGMANYEHQIKNTPSTKFRIASLSKSITQIAIDILEHRGILSKDDLLKKYLPVFPGAHKINITQLLNHTSGIMKLSNLEDYDNMAIQEFPLATLIDLLRAKPLLFEPGTSRKYSSSYIVLAAIIEKASGLSYSSFVEENIFKPAGMKNTFTETAEAILTEKAYGYMSDPVNGGMRKALHWDTSIKVASGNFSSTVEDIFLFFRAYLNGRLGIPADFHKDESVFYFQGNSPGYASFAKLYLDEELTIVVLSNNYSRAAWKIGHALGEIYLDHEYVTPHIDASVKPSEEELKTFAGKYPSENVILWVKYIDGKLVGEIERAGKPNKWFASAMVPLDKNSFLLPAWWEKVTFTKTKSGPYEIAWAVF